MTPDTCETGGYCGCHRGRPMNWNPDRSCPGCNCGTGDRPEYTTAPHVCVGQGCPVCGRDRPAVTDAQVEAAINAYVAEFDPLGFEGTGDHYAMRAALEAARRVQEEQENG